MRRRRQLTVTVGLALTLTASLVAQAGRRGDVLDINTASEKQLAAVTGMTPALTRAILDRRPFLAMTDVDAVLAQSMSEGQRAQAYRLIFLQVDANTATEGELRLVPGMTDRIAADITKSRSHTSLAQLRRQLNSLVDEKEATRLEQYLFVPIDLNTASDADIMSIPRMGQRMLREFKEYRPYKAIAQFRREIGKYVDDKEVARLERYVTIR